SFEGKVEYQKKMSSRWLPCAIGTVLGQDDNLRTKLNSKAEIGIDDNTTIIVEENTIININELYKSDEQGDQSSLKLLLGKVRAKVKRVLKKTEKFEVKTPTSVAGVRGTDFSVLYNMMGESLFSCHEGSVMVRSLVQKNQETLVEKNMEVAVDSSGNVAEPVKNRDAGGAESGSRSDEAGEGGGQAVTVTSPRSGELVTRNSIVITGKAAPGGKVNAVVNNGARKDTLAAPNGDFVFSSIMLTKQGVNSIIIFSEGPGGIKGEEAALEVVLDNEPPELGITSKIEEVTRNSPFNISGVISEPCSVFVNGVKAAEGKTEFSCNVDLVPFMNIISIKCVDRAGNGSEKSFKISFDNVAPTIQLTSPKQDEVIYEPRVYVSGKTEAGAEVTINKILPLENIDGIFGGFVSLNMSGKNTLTVIARDKAGNVSEPLYISVFVDVPPLPPGK
ncbi:MAG: FecR domain-containing protein, partial [Candidatus Margulisiibacteriota bacterium]